MPNQDCASVSTLSIIVPNVLTFEFIYEKIGLYRCTYSYHLDFKTSSSYIAIGSSPMFLERLGPYDFALLPPNLSSHMKPSICIWILLSYLRKYKAFLTELFNWSSSSDFLNCIFRTWRLTNCASMYVRKSNNGNRLCFSKLCSCQFFHAGLCLVCQSSGDNPPNMCELLSIKEIWTSCWGMVVGK